MELYKRTGTNPFSSCLPILSSRPSSSALFRVLNNLGTRSLDGAPQGDRADHPPVAEQIEHATIFGAELSATFLHAPQPGDQDRHGRAHHPDVGHDLHDPAPADAQEHAGLGAGQPVRQAAEGAALRDAGRSSRSPASTSRSVCCIYWFTTNVWSMGQQFYVIRRMPAPGSAAEKAYRARLERKGKEIPGLPRPPGPKADAAADEAAERQAVGPAPAADRRRSARRARQPARSRPVAPTAAGQHGRPGHCPAAPRRATARPRRPPRRTSSRPPAPPARTARPQEAGQRTPAAAPSPPRPDPPDRRRTT